MRHLVGTRKTNAGKKKIINLLFVETFHREQRKSVHLINRKRKYKLSHLQIVSSKCDINLVFSLLDRKQSII